MEGKYKALTGKIIGAAIEVHQHLGPGLLESAYETCLAYCRPDEVNEKDTAEDLDQFRAYVCEQTLADSIDLDGDPTATGLFSQDAELIIYWYDTLLYDESPRHPPPF